jgi:hypothetical protein
VTETAEPTVGVPEDLAANPAYQEKLEQIYKEVEQEGGLVPDPGVDFGPPQDESDTFFIGREFTLDEFRKWFAVQRLGSRPFNAVGYHHTEVPRPKDWAGTRSLKGIFDFYRDELEWPENMAIARALPGSTSALTPPTTASA